MRVCVWAHIWSIRLFKYYFHTANLTLNLPFANFTFSYRRQNRIPYGQRINHGTWNDKNEWFRAIGSSWWISPNIFGYWHRLYHITNRFPFSVKRVSRTFQIGAQYGCVCVKTIGSIIVDNSSNFTFWTGLWPNAPKSFKFHAMHWSVQTV